MTNTSELPDSTITATSTTEASAADAALLSGLRDTLGDDLVDRIVFKAKILLVGAGGIGCELLKNLALVGFRHVHIIDLDTIDVSNLNRQLLFRAQHVGHPKCTVACQVAQEQLAITTSLVKESEDDDNGGKDGFQYTACHGNVCDNEVLNVKLVSKFDLVLNALDNVQARRRVNRLCLAAVHPQMGKSVPLIEAGTTGYLGQVNVIDKSSGIACYECKSQEAQKVYPICTIRSTPSMPVHLIVWAKELYRLCFGEKVEESMLYEDIDNSNAGEDDDEEGKTTKGKNAEEEPQQREPSTYMTSVMEYRKILDQRRNGETDGGSSKEELQKLATTMISNLYADEIQKQLDMNRYKAARKTPVPLTPLDIDDATSLERVKAAAKSLEKDQLNVQAVWSATECISYLAACLCLENLPSSNSPILPAFDKDDDFSMQFVTAASQLRSYVFSIEPIQSLYAAKGIAGNIIPAIATTNAICAGLQILQVFKVLKQQMKNEEEEKKCKLKEGRDESSENKETGLRDCCNYINCVRAPTRNGLYVISTKLEDPNPNCFVCQKHNIPLALNIDNWTLREFIDTIVKKELGFEQPSIMLGDGGDCIIWEEGEDADIDSFGPNLTKSIKELPGGGVQDGASIHIEDFSQELSVEVVVTHRSEWPSLSDQQEKNGEDAAGEEDLKHKFLIGGKKPQAAVAASAVSVATGQDEKPVEEAAKENGIATANNPSTDTKEDDDDDSVMEVFEAPAKSNPSEKRKNVVEINDDDARPAKKAKTDEQEVIEID